jgi:hypothetical protein
VKGGLTRIASILLLQAAAIGAALTLAADVYAHKRTELVGGVNLWGYRGHVAQQRRPREIRLAFVGGTRTFGWGAAASETIPATVRWMITLATDLPGQPLRPIVDINLGQIGLPASRYAATLVRFEYLRPDVIIILDDLGADAGGVHDSRIERWTRYRPALPLVLEEKGMVWRYGSVMRGYDDSAHGAQPALPLALPGALLQAIGRGLRSIDEQTSPGRDDYVSAMSETLRIARAQAHAVVVAVGPATTAAQRERVAALQSHLAHLSDDAVTLVDLTSIAALHTSRVTLDGYNYNGDGRVLVADAITPPVLAWIQRGPLAAQD